LTFRFDVALERKAIYDMVESQAIAAKKKPRIDADQKLISLQEMFIPRTLLDESAFIRGSVCAENHRTAMFPGSVKFLAKLELLTRSEAYWARRFPTLAHQW
jgi:hypothetical protein